MSEEKIVLFTVDRKPEKLEGMDISEIQKYRSDLLQKNLIGKLTNQEPVEKFRGKDCGNISIRILDGKYSGNILISGSQTSNKPEVTLDDFVLVYDYIPEEFLVRCKGLIDPSSETPLHWSAYKADENINVAIHAHIFNYDSLRKHVENFFKEEDLPLTHSLSKSARNIGDELIPLIHKRGHKDVIGMPIHDGGYGLLSLGKNMQDAYERLMGFYSKLKSFSEL
jgi:hypothetical protein